MTTADVGKRLVALCSEFKYDQAALELYDESIVSVEGAPDPQGNVETVGKDAVLKKGEDWIANHEIHSAHCEGPFVATESFGVIFDFDVRNKPSGQRMKMRELAIYKVADGKIVREEFLYGQG